MKITTELRGITYPDGSTAASLRVQLPDGFIVDTGTYRTNNVFAEARAQLGADLVQAVEDGLRHLHAPTSFELLCLHAAVKSGTPPASQDNLPPPSSEWYLMDGTLSSVKRWSCHPTIKGAVELRVTAHVNGPYTEYWVVDYDEK